MGDHGVHRDDEAEACHERGRGLDRGGTAGRVAEGGTRWGWAEADQGKAGFQQRGQQRRGDGARLIPAASLPAQADGAGIALVGADMEVGRLEALWRQAEGMGELHDFEVAGGRLVGGGGLEWDEPVDAGIAGQQRQEGRLNLERCGGGQAPEGGEIAEELQGIAEAMVAAHENVLALEWPAVPDPAAVIGLGWIVPRGGITLGEDGVRDGPGGREIAVAHCGHPVGFGVPHAALNVPGMEGVAG